MAHPVDNYVGQQMRHRRWMIGMTQQQLADAVGIRFQQIQKYETGANRVSASRLWDIAAAMDVSVSFFFDGLDADDTGSDPTTPDVSNTRETLDLLRTYYAIPEAQRRRLFDLARSLGDAA